MILWFVLALMTAAAVFAVLWPLARARRQGRPAAAAPHRDEIAVYRDQLDEIERDRAAGRIGEAEAEAARVEVSRRLLAAAEQQAAADAARRATGGVAPRAAAVAWCAAAARRRSVSISRSARPTCRASRWRRVGRCRPSSSRSRR